MDIYSTVHQLTYIKIRSQVIRTHCLMDAQEYQHINGKGGRLERKVLNQLNTYTSRCVSVFCLVSRQQELPKSLEPKLE